ncbi:hypothetical protein DFH09DRAFT_83523 [Mycena vulgaris]|nr:hypothetical protein DFH09DRAFT_83523 [Mycena vulgaris]
MHAHQHVDSIAAAELPQVGRGAPLELPCELLRHKHILPDRRASTRDPDAPLRTFRALGTRLTVSAPEHVRRHRRHHAWPGPAAQVDRAPRDGAGLPPVQLAAVPVIPRRATAVRAECRLLHGAGPHPNVSIPWAQLTRITLSFPNPSTFHRVLTDCPNLRECTLEDYSTSMFRRGPPSRTRRCGRCGSGARISATSSRSCMHRTWTRCTRPARYSGSRTQRRCGPSRRCGSCIWRSCPSARRRRRSTSLFCASRSSTWSCSRTCPRGRCGRWRRTAA